MNHILTLPGIGNSGPQHWQTLWETSNPNFHRVQQRDWDHPVCSEWVETLEEAVVQSSPDVILVAHSLACLTVVHWASQTKQRIKAAMLVAVPNPTRDGFPSQATGFSPLPEQPLTFPSLLVASTNDPFSSLDHSRACANAWGSRLINVAAQGHINASSNLGAWDEGMELLRTLF
jgi:uncharacterized protein